MSDFRDMSDELHWKKELTALRKAARILRDPETTSSLRSPLSSRTAAGGSTLNYLGGTRGPSTARCQTGRYSELDSSSSSLKCTNTQKQVFLYNWRQPPSKSSDSGAKVDECRNFGNGEPMPGTSGDSSSDTNKVGSKSDTCHDEHVILSSEANFKTSTQKTVKKSKKNSAVSRRTVKRSANSKLLDYPSISIEQSDDTEYCNSEDLRISTHDMMRKSGYTSKPASPLLSKRENRSYSSKLIPKVHREDSSFSCTPASTSSYNRYRKKNHSTAESCGNTTASFNEDEADHLDLSRRQGCGIPCYWSKRTPKHRGCGVCYSPSLSDTLRRKGSRIFCGSQILNEKRQSSRSNKRKLVKKSSQGLPLLTNSCDGRGGSSIDSGESDDELSTNFGELDLEALSRLDGRRWSMSCGSQEGLELVALTGSDQGTPDHVRSLSQKYKPRFFDEIIGQNIVVQSLINATSRERIAPVYLFQGPRGTGKTSTARIFSAALNCLATEETKPCGSCRECTNFISGKGKDLREVDATNKKGIDRVKYLLKSLSMAPPSYFSHYKVFIVDECHLLPSKTWSEFMKFLEEPPAHIVFIFITTDLDNLPRTVLSRCQKYLFNKIRDADVVTRLKKLSDTENLDVESHALHLIALNADGSLRDAETMLEQLSLLGKKITASLVNELVGVVPDEKLLDLLELAMSSNTAETVRKSRELMDSGVDPMALMSQLAGLIMDIIAGTYHLVDSKCSGSFFGGRSLTEAELERLKQALKLLLEAEKQLRVSSERSTWFTAALLQLGSVPSPDPSHSSSSRKQSSKTTVEDQSNTSWELYAHKKKLNAQHMLQKSVSSSASSPRTVDERCGPSSHPRLLVDSSSLDARPHYSRVVEGGTSVLGESKVLRCLNPEKLDDIWNKCIERCHSKTLRQLLHAHGKLVSISEVEGVLLAYIAFEDGDVKSRAERFLSSITNSLETVMRHNVEVRLGLIGDSETSINRRRPLLPDSSELKTQEISGMVDRESNEEFSKLARGTPKRSDGSVTVVDGFNQVTTALPMYSEEEKHGNRKERKQDTPMQRIQAIIDEQRLESAWLQAAKGSTPRSLSRLKPEKNQILPQDGNSRQNEIASMILTGVSSRKWEDELNREIKALKINDTRGQQKEKTGQRFDHISMSPSLLHNRGYVGNFDKENLGYESGTSGGGGVNGVLCWKRSKHSKKGRVKAGTPVRLQKKKQFSCFGQCGKASKGNKKLKR
ncbi:hypothetical protein AQUCO_01400021v1 [Aquilegia coerulea]|uniref:AAA+ ATPase domain-containing protein n=1 Tax=Aquilegia coerulea TaxID=218851 RepID=A0A2G5DU40_AQUCA|nr:hypothetical protein AQUCO_01400021v1 [Aquilegia coerulea]